MIGSETALGSWLLHCAAGGGLVLFLSISAMRRCGQPALKQRVGEWGITAALILAALSLGPAWIVVPLLPIEKPYSIDSSPPANADLSTAQFAIGRDDSHTRLLDKVRLREEQAENGTDLVLLDTNPGAGVALPSALVVPVHRIPELGSSDAGADLQRQERSAAIAATPAVPAWFSRISAQLEKLIPGLGAAYLLVCVFLICRWLLGNFALRRLLRQARPACGDLASLFAKMAQGLRPQPRLLVSSRLRVPMSCGLWQPTIVVPASLCAAKARTMLRCVFAHELTHLERRDAWACFLFGLGQIVYFYLPWFWSMRRQVRLCQEYVADAAAVEHSADPEDYAQFLLSFTAAPAVPVGATGVLGNSSDLFRRVTMLLESPLSVQKCCSRWRSLAVACGLVLLAVLAGGISLQAQAAPPANDGTQVAYAPVPEQGKTNPLPKKDEPVKKDPARPLAEGEFNFGPGVANLTREQFMQMRDEMMKRMQQMQNQGGGMMMGQGMPGMGMMGGLGTPHEGRLGVMIQTPGETLVDQLDLPSGKGLVITQVQSNSAAAKAGLKAHDILLEFNGRAVSNEPAKLVHIIGDLKANTGIDAVVLRKGKKETIKGIKLPEAKAVMNMPGMGGMGMPGMGGMGGLGMGGMGMPGMGGMGMGKAMQAIPPLPMMPRLGPDLPMNPGQGGPGLGLQPGLNNQTVITSTFRTGDRFTTRHQEGSLIITVTGTVDEGKNKVSQIQVQDGNESAKFESVAKVPEQYRDKVKNLIEMNEKSNTRIELHRLEKEKDPAQGPKPKDH